MRNGILVLLLAIAVAVPAFGCPYDCLVTEYDDNSDGIIDARSVSCVGSGSGTSGSYGTCEVVRTCWRMPGAGRYCETGCEGYPCMVV